MALCRTQLKVCRFALQKGVLPIDNIPGLQKSVTKNQNYKSTKEEALKRLSFITYATSKQSVDYNLQLYGKVTLLPGTRYG